MIRAFVTIMLTAATLAWSGAASAAPGDPTQIVPGSMLTAKAEVIAKTFVHGNDQGLVPASSAYDQVVPRGALSVDAGIPLANPGYVAIPLEIWVAGKLVRTLYCSFRIVKYVNATIATHDLPADHLIVKDDLVLGRVPEMMHASDELDSLVGRRLRTPIRKGVPVVYEETAIDQIVRVGQMAVLIVHDGGVALSAEVVARSNGGIGESVAVYNARTDKLLSGVVTGANRVELTLPEGSGMQ